MSLDGALFDIDKLNYFSKEYHRQGARQVIGFRKSRLGRKYTMSSGSRLKRMSPISSKILNIEKERPNPRKDYAKYSDIEPLTRFFYEDDYKRSRLTRFRSIRVMTRTLSALFQDFALKMLYGVDETTWWKA
jgi:hypothetical protein